MRTHRVVVRHVQQSSPVRHYVICQQCGRKFDGNQKGTVYDPQSRRYMCKDCAKKRRRAEAQSRRAEQQRLEAINAAANPEPPRELTKQQKLVPVILFIIAGAMLLLSFILIGLDLNGESIISDIGTILFLVAGAPLAIAIVKTVKNAKATRRRPVPRAQPPMDTYGDHVRSRRPSPIRSGNPSTDCRRIDPKDDKAIEAVKEYCVVDCETTGFNRTNDRIIEIAILHYRNGDLIDSYTTLVNPGMHIPAQASNVNHIFDRDVADAPTYDEIAPIVASKLIGRTIIGHNVTFDLAFIGNMLGPSFDFDSVSYIDTLPYAKRVIAGLENYKLQTLLAYLHISPGTAHQAGDDARATAELFEVLREQRRHNIEMEKDAKRRQRNAERQQYEAAYANSPIFDKIFVFTGDFSRAREELEALARRAGGLTRGAVSGRTDYLVVGDVTYYPQSALENKLYKAQAMAEAGGKIRLIDEREFLDIVERAMIELGN